MALAPCRECGASISTEAPTCPHCGVPHPANVAPAPPTPPAVAGGAEAAVDFKVPGLLKLSFAVLGVWALYLIAGGSFSATPERARAPAPAPIAPAPTPPPDPFAPARDSAARQRRFAELRAKFNYSPDNVRGDGWFTHRRQGYDRTRLIVNVNRSGRTYLEAFYRGEDWIFFDHLVVRIGPRLLETSTIPSYSDQSRRDNGGGVVWEHLHFYNNDDNGVLRAIADADTATVRVRFQGDERHRDLTLTAADKQAIREAVELGKLLAFDPALRPREN